MRTNIVAMAGHPAIRLRALAFALLFPTGMAMLAEPAQAEGVGRMTAVQTAVARNGDTLAKGAEIALGDVLVSNATGLGMIVFRDQSSAKIGPNSRLVIDDFVYGGGSGQSGVRIDRGITRFYGGRISKKGRMQITTPHVVLAVRGGIVDVSVSGGSSIATLRAGRLTCTSNGTTKVITKPGFSCVSNGGQLAAVKNAGDFGILDSRSKVAGTDLPGTTGPGPDTETMCTGKNAERYDRCRSRDGQLPGGFDLSGGGPGTPPLVGDSGGQTTPTPPITINAGGGNGP